MQAFWNRIGKAGTPEVSLAPEIRQTVNQVVPVSRLNVKELCCKHDPQSLKFSTTADIPVSNNSIGQDQALKAIEFGIKMKSQGYNIFVCGLAGTGKNSAILEKVIGIAKSEPVPDDICYLFNFKSPQMPLVFFFPAGLAKEFKNDIEALILSVQSKIKVEFCSEQYERHCQKIESAFLNEKEQLDRQLKVFAETKKCDIKRNDYQITCQEVQDKIFDVKRTVRLKQRQTDSEICETDKKIISEILDKMFCGLEDKYRNINGILSYLNDMKMDFLNDIELYKPYNPSEEFNYFPMPAVSYKYTVNILVDNSESQGAPVITENNPSFSSLFGSIEYRTQNSAVTADHLSLLAGSVHRARGGYLIIEIEEILGDLHTWNALKKLLRYCEVRIENLSDHFGLAPAITLRPEVIPVNLKVILTGDPLFYQTLYNQDDEFVRLFKVKVDLVEQINKSDEIINEFVSFIARICKEEKLLHCDRFAVSRIIDFSTRLTDHKNRISAQFAKIADLLREANYYAAQNSSSYISEEHINLACEEYKNRCRVIEDKIYGLIEDGTIHIDTCGSEAGQVNGVSIIDTGDYAFGVPSRITVKTFIGSGNIINIEREAEMSGKIHAKGVLILSGYLGQTYAQDKPLALSASICFEQHYEEIDGDSASSAELYCLLSSLSGIPLCQNIAVTGSIDQRGRIQPVGGINLKIEGFFKTCRQRGLNGTHGMLIPAANVKNLMLGDEILKAVEQKMFHVYPVFTIDQGLQILTGKDPGVVMEDGSFQPDTIHFLVNKKLREFASVAACYEKERDQYV